MNKNELVTLKPCITNATFGGIAFKPNHFYRCEPEGQGYLIFGTYITAVDYNACFETAYDRVMRDWKELGLLTSEGKAITKTAFKALADIHTYGTGRRALHVWYFHTRRDLMYAFYPPQGTAKANHYDAYEFYLALVAGEMDVLDDKDVMFGNCGIPLNYRGLSVR